MPIVTGSTTVTSSAVQITTTKTQVVSLLLTAGTTCFIGASGVKADGTGGGVSIPTSSSSLGPVLVAGPQGTFNLTELYVIGTSGTLSWLAVTR